MFDVISIMTKTVLLGGSILCLGSLLALIFLGGLSPTSDTAARRVGLASAGLGACAALFALVLLALELAGDLQAAFEPEIMALTLQSPPAFSAALRLSAFGVAAFVLHRCRESSMSGWMAVGLLVGSFAVTGHTATHEPTWALRALLVLHIAAAGFWLGSLWPLRVAVQHAQVASAGALLERFGRIATVGVLVLVVVGGSLTGLLAGFDLLALSQRPWGLLLYAKLTLVAAMLGLALRHRSVLTPSYLAGTAGAGERLVRSIDLEIGVAGLVIFATALLSSQAAPTGPSL